MRPARPLSPLAPRAEAAGARMPAAPEEARAALASELAALLQALPQVGAVVRAVGEGVDPYVEGRAGGLRPTELGVLLLGLPLLEADERVVWTDGELCCLELLRLDPHGWILARVVLDLAGDAPPPVTLDQPPEHPH